MTILFSVLTTVYVTATVAGLAYQNVKPILEYVPSVTAAFVKVAAKAKEQWEQVMLPEDRKQSEQAKAFLEKYQPLANWVLRKVAIHLVVAWSILGVSLGVLILSFGLLLHFNAINSPITLGEWIIRAWIILLIPALAAVGSVIGILNGNWLSRLQTSITTTLKQSVADTVSWSGLVSSGKMIYEDIAQAYSLSVSFSSISKEEREFILRYVEVLERLRVMDAMAANIAWLQLDVSGNAEALAKKGNDYLSTSSYNESYYCYVCALDALTKEKYITPEPSSDDKHNQDKQKKLEAEILYQLGRLLARQNDERRAIQYFEKVIELDRTYKKRIFSPQNEFVDNIREKDAFVKFTKRYNKPRVIQKAKTPSSDLEKQVTLSSNKDATKNAPSKNVWWERFRIFGRKSPRP